MSDLELAANHQALIVDRAGDLLVITPVGDPIEFSSAIFQSEFVRVKKLAARPEFRNVLVDMSNASYFGSEMIGSLLELRRAVAASHGQEISDDDQTGGSLLNGGVMALSGLSSDMAAGLKVMNIDRLLLTFDTKAQAVRTMANQSLMDRLRKAKRPWMTTALIIPVAFLIVAFLLVPLVSSLFRTGPDDDYRAIVAAYERWTNRKEKALGGEEAARLAKPIIEELGAIELRGGESSSDQSYRQVATSASYLVEWIRVPASGVAKTQFVRSLEEARSSLSDDGYKSLDFPGELQEHLDRVGSDSDTPSKDAANVKKSTSGEDVGGHDAAHASKTEQSADRPKEPSVSNSGEVSDSAKSKDDVSEDTETEEPADPSTSTAETGPEK